MKSRNIIISILMFILLQAAFVAAQEETTTPPQLTEKTFKIQYADVRQEVYPVLRQMISRWGKIIVNEASSTIIIREVADSLPQIEKAISDIDKKPHQLQLTFFAFSAKREGAANMPAGIPADVTEALTEVQKVMAYKSYELLDSGLLNLSSNSRGGNIKIGKGFEIDFNVEYSMQSNYLRMNTLRLHQHHNGDMVTLMRTELGIGNNEVVVAGASKLNGGDEAVLLIISMAVTE